MTELTLFCRVNTQWHESLGIGARVDAAYRKVLALAGLARAAGLDVEAVSLPVVRRPVGGRRLSERQTAFRVFPALGRPPLDRLLAAAVFLGVALRRAGPQRRFLFYNFFPEYLPAAFFLWATGRPALLDIEDAPRADEPGWRGRITRFSFRCMRRLTRPRCLVVSRRIADDFGLAGSLVFYGLQPLATRRPNLAAATDELLVLFGGSLLPETGLDLFLATLDLLRRRNPRLGRRLRLIVTGFGGEAAFAALPAQLGDEITFDYRPGLGIAEYEQLLRQAHVGLCLKLPGLEMGDTTFPSKVVEIVCAGMLLLSTPVSDVPVIFGKDAAVFVNKPLADELAEILVGIAKRPDDYLLIAENGMRVAEKIFSTDKVVGDFIDLIS